MGKMGSIVGAKLRSAGAFTPLICMLKNALDLEVGDTEKFLTISLAWFLI